MVYTGIMIGNLRQYLFPIGAVVLVLLAGIVGYFATSWFTGTDTTTPVITTLPAGPTLPGYSFNISVSSRLPALPIDPDSVNPGRLAEVLGILGVQSQSQPFGVFGQVERVTPTQVNVVYADITALDSAGQAQLVGPTRSDGKLVQGLLSDYDPANPDSITYYLYQHPDLYPADYPLETNQYYANRALMAILYEAMIGSRSNDRDHYLGTIEQAFPDPDSKPPVFRVVSERSGRQDEVTKLAIGRQKIPAFAGMTGGAGMTTLDPIGLTFTHASRMTPLRQGFEGQAPTSPRLRGEGNLENEGMIKSNLLSLISNLLSPITSFISPTQTYAYCSGSYLCGSSHFICQCQGSPGGSCTDSRQGQQCGDPDTPGTCRCDDVCYAEGGQGSFSCSGSTQSACSASFGSACPSGQCGVDGECYWYTPTPTPPDDADPDGCYGCSAPGAGFCMWHNDCPSWGGNCDSCSGGDPTPTPTPTPTPATSMLGRVTVDIYHDGNPNNNGQYTSIQRNTHGCGPEYITIDNVGVSYDGPTSGNVNVNTVNNSATPACNPHPWYGTTNMTGGTYTIQPILPNNDWHLSGASYGGDATCSNYNFWNQSISCNIANWSQNNHIWLTLSQCPTNISHTCTWSGDQVTFNWNPPPDYPPTSGYYGRLNNDPTNNAQCTNSNGDPVGWFCSPQDQWLNISAGSESHTTAVTPGDVYDFSIQNAPNGCRRPMPDLRFTCLGASRGDGRA